MMIWDKYRKEVEHINVEDTFQNKLINTLHSQQNTHEKKMRFTLRYAMTCMILCICLISMMIVYFNSTSNVEKKKISEKLTAKIPSLYVEDPTSKNSMGVLSFSAINPKIDFKTNNPWKTNSKLKTLPVYRNGIITDATNGAVIEGGWDDEELNQVFNKYKEIFQFQDEQSNLSDDMDIYCIYPEGSLCVNRDGTISISLKVTNEFAKQFQKEVHTREEAQQMALLFADAYKSQLALKKPLPDVSIEYQTERNGNNMKITSKQYSYAVYEKKATLSEQIEAYNFKKIEFSFLDVPINSSSVEESQTIFIKVYKDIKGEEIGDYPILSLEEAKNQFHEGNYFTNSPHPKENEEIAYADLIYKYSPQCEYIVPFYRIYAPADNQLYFKLEEGKYYGVYYVAAIEQQYINNK